MMAEAMLRALGFDPEKFKVQAIDAQKQAIELLAEFRAHNLRVEKKMDLILEAVYDKDALQKKLQEIFPSIN